MQGSQQSVERTVLLVEDFEPFRNLVRYRLQMRPELHIVGEVSDGNEAMSIAVTLKPDLIITDIGLPSSDGLVVARAIRRMSSVCKIIFLSDHTSNEIVREAFGIGANAFVAKFDLGELMLAIDAVFNGERYLSRRVSGTLDDPAPPTRS